MKHSKSFHGIAAKRESKQENLETKKSKKLRLKQTKKTKPGALKSSIASLFLRTVKFWDLETFNMVSSTAPGASPIR